MKTKTFGSKGVQVKEFVDDLVYKVDSPGWVESISEVLVAELQYNIVNALPFVDYNFCRYLLSNACVCKNFLGSGEWSKSIRGNLEGIGYNLPEEGSGEELLKALVGLTNIEYRKDIYYYLSYMIYLDAITLNEDRHLGNIIYIFNEKNRLVRMAPIFDNGLSLFSDRVTYSGSYEENLSIVRSRPFLEKFEEQVGLFENPGIRIKNSIFKKLKMAVDNPSLYINDDRKGELSKSAYYLIRRLEDTKNKLWFEV